MLLILSFVLHRFLSIPLALAPLPCVNKRQEIIEVGGCEEQVCAPGQITGVNLNYKFGPQTSSNTVPDISRRAPARTEGDMEEGEEQDEVRGR